MRKRKLKNLQKINGRVTKEKALRVTKEDSKAAKEKAWKEQRKL